MMYLLSLSGLPSNIKTKQVISFFKDANIQQISYWIRSYTKKDLEDTKKIIIEVYSKHDADKLVSILSGKTFISNNNTEYTCRIIIESKSPMASTVNPHKWSFQRNMVPPKKENSKNNDSNSMPKEAKDNDVIMRVPVLPRFNHPKKILVNELQDLIKKHCKTQLAICQRAVCIQMRMRLSQLFEGKNVTEVYAIPVSEIISIYRNKYDESTDERFIINTYKLVQTAIWPTAETIKDGIYLEELAQEEDDGNVDVNISESTEITMAEIDDDYLDKVSIGDDDDWSVYSLSDE